MERWPSGSKANDLLTGFKRNPGTRGQTVFKLIWRDGRVVEMRMSISRFPKGNQEPRGISFL